MPRVVLDTNIIVSGILSPTGASRALLDLARSSRMAVVTSTVLLDELEEVLGRFMPADAASEVRTAMQELAYLVRPEEVPAVARDRDDDHVLAAAVAGKVSYIVTRDRDLLDLGSHAEIPVLQPAPALSAIRADAEQAGGG